MSYVFHLSNQFVLEKQFIVLTSCLQTDTVFIVLLDYVVTVNYGVNCPEGPMPFYSSI